MRAEPRTVLSRLTLATRSSTLVFITPRSALRVRGQRCPQTLACPPLFPSSPNSPRPLLAAAPVIIMRSVFRPLFTFIANKNSMRHLVCRATALRRGCPSGGGRRVVRPLAQSIFKVALVIPGQDVAGFTPAPSATAAAAAYVVSNTTIISPLPPDVASAAAACCF